MRWSYDTDHPPPQAFEAVAGAQALLVSGGRLVSGTLYLASSDQIYAHEEPVDKPADGRWVTVQELQEAGGVPVSPDGLRRVKVHVKVSSVMGAVQSPHTWHAAMHNRIALSLIGQVPVLTRSTSDENGFRQHTEPSRAEYYGPDEGNTYESFAVYAITLQPLSS